MTQTTLLWNDGEEEMFVLRRFAAAAAAAAAAGARFLSQVCFADIFCSGTNNARAVPSRASVIRPYPDPHLPPPSVDCRIREFDCSSEAEGIER